MKLESTNKFLWIIFIALIIGFVLAMFYGNLQISAWWVGMSTGLFICDIGSEYFWKEAERVED